MRITDIKKLRSGDEVYWNDPDKSGAEFDCSRVYKIRSIEFVPLNMVRIWDVDGSVLECFARELS